VRIHIWSLLAPIWLVGLPIVALVGAIAVFFETTPILRGSLGNVVYFFGWIGLLMLSAGRLFTNLEDAKARNDVFGLSRPLTNLRHTMQMNGLDPTTGTTDLVVPTRNHPVDTFEWAGMDWTHKLVLERLIWLGIAPLIAVTAALPFNRFDPAQSRLPRAARRRRHTKTQLDVTLDSRTHSALRALPDLFLGLQRVINKLWLSTIGHLPPFWRVVFAELQLNLKGRAWWWVVGILGINIACIASPPTVTYQFLIPLLWLWLLPLWSALGSREYRHQTLHLIWSTPHPLHRQLFASWTASTLATLLLTSGAVFSFLRHGDAERIFGMLAGILFVTALGLMLGVWSHTSRLFEIIYLVLWYGSYANIAAADFTGTHYPASAWTVPMIYSGLSLLLMGLTAAGRKHEVQH
jgi:hypothetical protein